MVRISFGSASVLLILFGFIAQFVNKADWNVPRSIGTGEDRPVTFRNQLKYGLWIIAFFFALISFQAA